MFAPRINAAPIINSFRHFLKLIPLVVNIKIDNIAYADAAMQAGINLKATSPIINELLINVEL